MLDIVTLACLGGVYLWRRRARIRRHEEDIRNSGDMPRENCFSFVPEKEPPAPVRGLEMPFRGNGGVAGGITGTDIPPLLDGLAAAIDPLEALSRIDLGVVDALDFSSARDLSDFGDLKDEVSRHMGDMDDPSGWYHRLHGYVAERAAGHAMEAAGHTVEFPDTPNQEGFDLLVDGEPFQVKSGLDAHAVSDHLAHHPDIPVFTTPDVAAHFPHDHAVIGLHELDHSAIDSSIHGTFDAIDHGHITGDFHFPWITGTISGWREAKLLGNGDTTFGSAARNWGLDVAGTGGGGLVGAKAGAILLSVLGPVGAGIGAALGGIGGALWGRRLTNKIKRTPLELARKRCEDAYGNGISGPLNETRAGLSKLVDEENAKFAALRERIGEDAARRIGERRTEYLQLVAEFTCNFPAVLDDVATNLEMEKRGALSQIGRSSVFVRLFWPSRSDIYSRIVSAWFNRKELELAQYRKEFGPYAGQPGSEEEINRRFERIREFLSEHSLSHDGLAGICAELRVELDALEAQVEKIRGDARAQVKSGRDTALAGMERFLSGTYANLTAALKEGGKRLAAAREAVATEARRLGIAGA
jgi:hypothetical protein